MGNGWMGLGLRSTGSTSSLLPPAQQTEEAPADSYRPDSVPGSGGWTFTHPPLTLACLGDVCPTLVFPTRSQQFLEGLGNG